MKDLIEKLEINGIKVVNNQIAKADLERAVVVANLKIGWNRHIPNEKFMTMDHGDGKAYDTKRKIETQEGHWYYSYDGTRLDGDIGPSYLGGNSERDKERFRNRGKYTARIMSHRGSRGGPNMDFFDSLADAKRFVEKLVDTRYINKEKRNERS